MAFTYRDMGHAFREHIICILCNGWMDCRDVFQCFFRKASSKEAKCEDYGDSIATCSNTTNLFRVSQLVNQYIFTVAGRATVHNIVNPIAFKFKAH